MFLKSIDGGHTKMGPSPVKFPWENEVAVMSSRVCLTSEAPGEQ